MEKLRFVINAEAMNPWHVNKTTQKSSYDSMRYCIRIYIQRGVPAIHLLTGILNSLEDDEQTREEDDGDPDDLATFNMLLASPDSEIDLDSTQDDSDVIYFMEGEAALGRPSASLANSQLTANAPIKYFPLGV